MSKRIFIILGVIVTLIWIIATIYAFVFYGRSDNTNTSTPDELVASVDSATPDVIEPTEEPTEKPTQEVTDTPTEVPTELEVKATEQNIVVMETVKETEIPKVTTSSSDEQYLLARLIYLEAGNCSEYCQWLVGSTAMNLADINGGLSAVAYNYNLFNVAYLIDGCTPSQMSLNVAARVLSGDRDYNVKAFRTDYYHGFGIPYTNIDNVYFSSY